MVLFPTISFVVIFVVTFVFVVMQTQRCWFDDKQNMYIIYVHCKYILSILLLLSTSTCSFLFEFISSIFSLKCNSMYLANWSLPTSGSFHKFFVYNNLYHVTFLSLFSSLASTIWSITTAIVFTNLPERSHNPSRCL